MERGVAGWHRASMSYTRFFPQPSETVSYQWHVSPRFKFAYNAIPKAATTGILRALQMAEVDGDESKIGQPHERDHSPLKRIEDLGLEPAQVLTGNDYFRFTYVRNPITRILSAYLDKMVRHEHERQFNARVMRELRRAAAVELKCH